MRSGPSDTTDAGWAATALFRPHQRSQCRYDFREHCALPGRASIGTRPVSAPCCRFPVTGTDPRDRSNTCPSVKCDALLYFHMNSPHHPPAESVTEIRLVQDPDTPDFFGCTAVVLAMGSDPDKTVYYGPGSAEYKSWDSLLVAGVKMFPRCHDRAELDAVLKYLVQKVEARGHTSG